MASCVRIGGEEVIQGRGLREGVLRDGEGSTHSPQTLSPRPSRRVSIIIFVISVASLGSYWCTLNIDLSPPFFFPLVIVGERLPDRRWPSTAITAIVFMRMTDSGRRLGGRASGPVPAAFSSSSMSFMSVYAAERDDRIALGSPPNGRTALIAEANVCRSLR